MTLISKPEVNVKQFFNESVIGSQTHSTLFVYFWQTIACLEYKSNSKQLFLSFHSFIRDDYKTQLIKLRARMQRAMLLLYLIKVTASWQNRTKKIQIRSASESKFPSLGDWRYYRLYTGDVVYVTIELLQWNDNFLSRNTHLSYDFLE